RQLSAAGTALFFVSALMAAAALVLIALKSGRPPMSNTYETIILMAASIPLVYLLLMKQDSGRIVAAGLSILCLILLAVTSFMDKAPRPLVPALKSNWLTVHVAFSFISYAAFAAAFISAIVYLASMDKNASKADESAYRSILFGYPFLTLGIVTGAIWANQAWGSYWSWDPKETWALITWLIYGAYLHMRISMGIKGTKSSIMAIIGFGLVLFTYFGVNYLLSGLHSYK
ncbi:MAG TPA: cytochrome c biogenesis protein CcsA, partial [Candidatus Goldiibacteriota bacterium]|nr:cytochrome c biogenesis protein CcsA [Candidatus Goldiibacteriota bacterium]